MDCTPPSLIAASAASITKLPIKRKSPSDSNPFNLVPVPELVSSPSESIVPGMFDRSPTLNLADLIPTPADWTAKPPPLKFHRIWTELNEIHFLHCLLDSTSEGLVFPRDLQLFYDRFSTSIGQPYTKSQLSEKLRRLRKKFRVTSARLSRGLDPMTLSPHDQALYELSQKLWDPECSSSMSFVSNSNQRNRNGGNNKVDVGDARIGMVRLLPLSPSLRLCKSPNQIEQKEKVDVLDVDDNMIGVGGYHPVVGVKMSEVSIDDCDFALRKEDNHPSNCGIRLGGLAAETVLNVFDQCVKEFRVSLFNKWLKYPLNESGHSVSFTSNAKDVDFERRWEEQRAVELDMFTRRLRLVLKKSLHQQ